MAYRQSILGLVIAGLVATIVGCSGSGRLQFDSPESAFERGMELYERERYTRAIEVFRSVFDFGRTHEVAADAQIHLARSYFHNREFLLAANEYTRFLEFYRADPRREEAEFERALSYYELSPPYQLDQTDTERAISHLTVYVQRYPSGQYLEEAGNMISELREKLARKAYEIGKLYERRRWYEAAAIQYESVVDRYPETGYGDNALVGAVRSYVAYADQSVERRQPERLQKAVDTYERLLQIYPNSPVIREAEPYYAQARQRLDLLATTVES